MYKDDFLNALKRTDNLKLNYLDFKISENKTYISDNALIQLSKLFEEEGVWCSLDIPFQCIRNTILVKPIVDNFFNTNTLITIGWVKIDSDDLFFLDDKKIGELLEGQNDKSDFNMHVWLTLPSLEIIDVTLYLNYMYMRNSSSKKSPMLVADNPDNLASNKIIFNPLLVGDDFLYKIGAIKQFAIWG